MEDREKLTETDETEVKEEADSRSASTEKSDITGEALESIPLSNNTPPSSQDDDGALASSPSNGEEKEEDNSSHSPKNEPNPEEQFQDFNDPADGEVGEFADVSFDSPDTVPSQADNGEETPSSDEISPSPSPDPSLSSDDLPNSSENSLRLETVEDEFHSNSEPEDGEAEEFAEIPFDSPSEVPSPKLEELDSSKVAVESPLISESSSVDASDPLASGEEEVEQSDNVQEKKEAKETAKIEDTSPEDASKLSPFGHDSDDILTPASDLALPLDSSEADGVTEIPPNQTEKKESVRDEVEDEDEDDEEAKGDDGEDEDEVDLETQQTDSSRLAKDDGEQTHSSENGKDHESYDEKEVGKEDLSEGGSFPSPDVDADEDALNTSATDEEIPEVVHIPERFALSEGEVVSDDEAEGEGEFHSDGDPETPTDGSNEEVPEGVEVDISPIQESTAVLEIEI